MRICYCFDIDDQEIRQAIRAGAWSGADDAPFCAAGSRCGGCRSIVTFLQVDEQLRAEEAARQHGELTEAATPIDR